MLPNIRYPKKLRAQKLCINGCLDEIFMMKGLKGYSFLIENIQLINNMDNYIRIMDKWNFRRLGTSALRQIIADTFKIGPIHRFFQIMCYMNKSYASEMVAMKKERFIFLNRGYLIIF